MGARARLGRGLVVEEASLLPRSSFQSLSLGFISLTLHFAPRFALASQGSVKVFVTGCGAWTEGKRERASPWLTPGVRPGLCPPPVQNLG